MRTTRAALAVAITGAMLVTGSPTVEAVSRHPENDKRACVTAYELRHVTPGMTRKAAYTLLDGAGSGRTTSVRSYLRCEYKAVVQVSFTRAGKVSKAVQLVPAKPTKIITQAHSEELGVDCTAMVSHWRDQARVTHWVFNKTVWRWVEVWGPWTTVKAYDKPATALECPLPPPPPVDTTPPGVVTGLTLTGSTSTSLSLAWSNPSASSMMSGWPSSSSPGMGTTRLE